MSIGFGQSRNAQGENTEEREKNRESGYRIEPSTMIQGECVYCPEFETRSIVTSNGVVPASSARYAMNAEEW